MANAHIVSVLCAEFGPKLAYVVLKEVLIKFHWDPPCGPRVPRDVRYCHTESGFPYVARADTFTDTNASRSAAIVQIAAD